MKIGYARVSTVDQAAGEEAQVRDLDAWAAKLRAENVTFLEQPHPLGDTRALMIEGPSHEAIELVEVK